MRLVSKHVIVIQCIFLAIICIFSIPSSSHGDTKNGTQTNESGLPIQKKLLKTIIVDNYYPYTYVNQKENPDGFSVDLVK